MRLCIKNDEFCIKDEELFIKNEEFCTENDEYCRLPLQLEEAAAKAVEPAALRIVAVDYVASVVERMRAT